MSSPSTAAFVGYSHPSVKPAGSIRKVTDIRARFIVRTVDVCTAGEAVALHCSTGEGILVVILPLKEFVEKCRAVRDANGRAFPAPVEALPLPEPSTLPKRGWGTGRKLTPERAALYEAVLCDFARGMRECDAARKHGVNVFSFNSWRSRQADLPARLDAYRTTAPVMKPNGKIL